MELRQLRSFVALAEELNFTRAAARLHLAQPSLSRQIRELEDRVGARLLERGPRGVALTPAGEALLPGARRALAAVEEAMRAARLAAAPPHRVLRVGFVEFAAHALGPALLREARERDLALEVRDLFTPQQLALLRSGGLDAGFVAHGPELDADPAFAHEVVWREPCCVAVPETHPLRAAVRVHLRDLAGEPLVTFPRANAPDFTATVERSCRAHGFAPRVVAEAALLQTLLSAVSAGTGLAVLPGTARAFPRPGVAFRDLDGMPPAELRVVWRRDDRREELGEFLAAVRAGSNVGG